MGSVGNAVSNVASGVNNAVRGVVKNIPIVGGVADNLLGTLSGDTKNPQLANTEGAQQAIHSAAAQQASLAAAIAAQQAKPVTAQTVAAQNLGDLGANRTINEQQQATNYLQRAAAGQTPSVAQQQLQQNTDRSISQNMAQAAAARGGGGNAGLLAQNVMRSNAATMANANQGAAQLRAQEMATNMSNYANQSNAQRGQDIGQATTQAQQYFNADQLNAANNLAAQQAQNTAVQNLYGLSNQALNTQANAATGMYNTQQGAYNAATQANNQMMGGLLQGGGAALGGFLASDKSLKKDIKPADDKIKDFLETIKAEEYSYKDPKNGKGKFVSPMAQDLEKTDVGKSMVVDTPEGKMVDYRRGLATMLAAQASLNDRIGDMEKALSMKKRKA